MSTLTEASWSPCARPCWAAPPLIPHSWPTAAEPYQGTSSLGHRICCCLFVYFWLCWVLVAVRELYLVAVSGGCSLVAVCSLLVAVASLVAEHRLWGARASVVAVRKLSCPEACGIFPAQG